jgi:hypothetical protein
MKKGAGASLRTPPSSCTLATSELQAWPAELRFSLLLLCCLLSSLLGLLCIFLGLLSGLLGLLCIFLGLLSSLLGLLCVFLRLV